MACLTGPKLYKEPSFKSNKFIIHNAITRCCLAGKVNEPQKNKIVEVSYAAGLRFQPSAALITSPLSFSLSRSLFCFSGNGEEHGQPLPHTLQRRQLPVQSRLHHEPWNRGDGTAHWHRPPSHRTRDGRVYLQVQLRPEAIHRHPVQNYVHERGRLHHPHSLLAEAPRDSQEAWHPQMKTYAGWVLQPREPTPNLTPKNPQFFFFFHKALKIVYCSVALTSGQVDSEPFDYEGWLWLWGVWLWRLTLTIPHAKGQSLTPPAIVIAIDLLIGSAQST